LDEVAVAADEHAGELMALEDALETLAKPALIGRPATD
jgi:hypothetical protein